MQIFSNLLKKLNQQENIWKIFALDHWQVEISTHLAIAILIWQVQF
jgi:hypothetical protein